MAEVLMRARGDGVQPVPGGKEGRGKGRQKAQHRRVRGPGGARS